MSRGAASPNIDSEGRLREEVRSLRDELRRLTLRVDQQGDQLSDLQDSFSASISSQSFEVVSGVGAASAPSAAPTPTGLS
jgi:hypothetical protein